MLFILYWAQIAENSATKFFNVNIYSKSNIIVLLHVCFDGQLQVAPSMHSSHNSINLRLRLKFAFFRLPKFFAIIILVDISQIDYKLWCHKWVWCAPFIVGFPPFCLFWIWWLIWYYPTGGNLLDRTTKFYICCKLDITTLLGLKVCFFKICFLSSRNNSTAIGLENIYMKVSYILWIDFSFLD